MLTIKPNKYIYLQNSFLEAIETKGSSPSDMLVNAQIFIHGVVEPLNMTDLEEIEYHELEDLILDYARGA